jgi:transmembrane sensor
MLDAQDLPLGTVIERANRNGDTAVRLADPALAARRVTGRFDIADSAALARKLAAALDLDVSTNGEGILLSPRAQKRGE